MLRVKPGSYGDAVRATRDRRNLSQAEAAREIGVSERTLQGWEIADVVPQPRHRRAILEWLDDEDEAA